MPDQVRVGSSPINGLGVFAERLLHPGKKILVIDDSRIVDGAHPLEPSDDPRHCDYLEAERVVLMQSAERHINHCCDPNTYVTTIDGQRTVVALREIRKGDEVTYDYCINSSGDTVWSCDCGAARCRHVIHSDFFHQPLDLQREYFPLLDSWFRRERSVTSPVLKKN